jgi:hypothetical protein
MGEVKMRRFKLAFLSALMALAVTAHAGKREDLLAKSNQIITAAQAEGVFVPVDNGEEVVVLHPASGLKCFFGVHGNGSIQLRAGSRRRDDVSCETNSSSARWTVSVHRRLKGYGLGDAIADTLQELARQYPDSAMTESSRSGILSDPAMKDSWTSAPFETRGRGARSIFANAAVNGEWVITMIFAGPRKSTTEGLNGMTWHATLVEVAREQK